MSFVTSRICRALLLSVLLSIFLLATASAQQLQAPKSQPIGRESSVAKAVQKNLHGADMEGKDGPMSKASSSLIELYERLQLASSKSSREQVLKKTVATAGPEGVAIDAVAEESGQQLRADLQGLGLSRSAVAGKIVSGLLPVEQIPEAARLSSLRSIRPTIARTTVGDVTTQGDGAMRADAARSEQNVDGTGVKVGVISDTYNQKIDLGVDDADDDIQSGDLPPSSKIEILDDPSISDPKDEGRAMMQIVRDVAPGASQAFHGGISGIGNMVNAIRDLAAAGSDIIVDDLGFAAAPFFQDGQIAQVADSVANEGVPYFSAAGNSDQNSYQNGFRSLDVGSGRTFHNFGGSQSEDIYQEVRIPVGQSVIIDLQWTDPHAVVEGSGFPDSDLDIFLVDDTLGIQQSSQSNNTARPVEAFQFTNDGSVDADGDGNPDTRFSIAIELRDGPAPDLIKYLEFGGVSLDIREYDTESSTSFGHQNAANVAGVGAARFSDTPEFGTNPPEIRDFSSKGGTPIYFDDSGNRLSSPVTRSKPDFVAPDGADNTFFGKDTDGDGFPNFPGTSAAAPHAAGAAALMLEQNPSSTPSEIYQSLEETAVDMDDPTTAGFDDGFDFRTGHGLIQIDQAIQVLSSLSTPSNLTAELEDGDVTLSWDPVQISGLKGYRIYRSTGAPDTGDPPLNETLVSDTSYVDDPKPGQTYYYAVTSVDGQGGESSLSEEASAFLYPQEVSAQVSRSFGEASGPQDYRLAALPGRVDTSLAQVLEGEAGTQWQAYLDDGSQENFFQRYDDGSEAFRFEAGNGFWVTATGGLSFEASVPAVALQGDSATTISLQEGWNVISNPLGKDVAWSEVRAATGTDLQPLWAFGGSFDTTGTFASAAEGRAYYFFNEENGPDSLIVPYPGAPETKGAKPKQIASEQATPVAAKPESVSTLVLTGSTADGPASKVSVGLAGSAGEEKTVIAPPGRFEPVSLRIQNPKAGSPRTERLMTATRVSEEEGHTFQIRLTSRTGKQVELSAEGLQEAGIQGARLLHPNAGKTYDLSEEPAVTIGPEDGLTGGESVKLKLAVGTESYAEQEAEQVLPDEVVFKSYPNPVRQQGTLEYALPEAGEVTLKVYDVLGREVATLEQGRKQAGRHQVTFEAERLSSGAYFGRLEAGGQTRTQKITVVR